ncbi:tyrosine-type recombinase/integrase [Clostridium sp.]|uniref:tyrosine-type recombinase/integrase n=1 Tax=Clostridium sp. TaxID=1506 RepID=UPI002614E5A9|nr:tyrosine-type recombinase/integrase [Clostridium sp.]
MEYKNCNDELSVILLGRLTVELPELEVNLQKQLSIKKIIDEVLYKYEVTIKETSLIASDIEQKATLYLACKKLEGVSERTLYNYRLELQHLNEFFNKPVTTINSMDIRMYMASIGKDVQANTLNTKMVPIRDFFQWLQNEEYLISNPTKKVKAVKEPIRERDPLTDKQVEIIREGLTDIRDKAIFEFLLATGTRLSEAVNVKLDDLDMERMSLLVIGKGNKQRRVFFNDRTRIVIEKYISTRAGQCEYLFSSSRRPYRQLKQRAVQLIIEKIENKTNPGKHLYPHIFRHTFATKALNYMPLETVQALLGHSQISTTQIYAKTSEANTEFMYRKIG